MTCPGFLALAVTLRDNAFLKQSKAKQGKANRGKARQGEQKPRLKTWDKPKPKLKLMLRPQPQSNAKQSDAKQGKARQGKTGQGKAWQGKTKPKPNLCRDMSSSCLGTSRSPIRLLGRYDVSRHRSRDMSSFCFAVAVASLWCRGDAA